MNNKNHLHASAGLTWHKTLACAMIALSVWAGAAAPRAHKTGQTQDSIPANLRTSLHQEIEINASPSRVYEALLNSKEFAAITGEPAQIGTKEGGSLSMFDGKITGRNIELIPNQMIVQAWRPGTWGRGVYSVVKFELKANGPTTTLILDQTGFPEGDYESLSGGWASHYWEPMKKHFS